MGSNKICGCLKVRALYLDACALVSDIFLCKGSYRKDVIRIKTIHAHTNTDGRAGCGKQLSGNRGINVSRDFGPRTYWFVAVSDCLDRGLRNFKRAMPLARLLRIQVLHPMWSALPVRNTMKTTVLCRACCLSSLSQQDLPSSVVVRLACESGWEPPQVPSWVFPLAIAFHKCEGDGQRHRETRIPWKPQLQWIML